MSVWLAVCRQFARLLNARGRAVAMTGIPKTSLQQYLASGALAPEAAS